ncbi:MAG: peptidoglycan bridge formation glycyltransferase FemA/FemB family protein [Thermomicrobia bacterium]|nr:peptidoglycan bridge formation glycyltransferase FemA/FemB family protein [Thermomicrobia bacterium]
MTSSTDLITPTNETDLDSASRYDVRADDACASVLQRHPWGAFKERHGWRVVRDAGDGFAVQMLLKRRFGVTIAYVPRGPAVDWADHSAVTACFEKMNAVCKREGIVLALIEPDAMLPRDFDFRRYGLSPSHLSVQPLRTIIVRCDRDDDALLAAMKQKTRYNVRLAAKRGVTVRKGSIDDLPAFGALLQTTATRDAFGVRTLDYYADLLRFFPTPNHGALLCAEYGGEIVAAAIVLRGGPKAIYLAGASSDTHREHMPTYALQYAALQWARDAGCMHYDLWGIPPTDTPPDAVQGEQQNVRDGLWGVYRFKQGFGGDVVSYPGIFVRHCRPVIGRIALRAINRQRGTLG